MRHELIIGVERGRRWSDDEKLLILDEVEARALYAARPGAIDGYAAEQASEFSPNDGHFRWTGLAMLDRAITALTSILRPRVSLSNSRLETLCLLVIGMVSARSVNLGHIASERPGEAQIAATYRRLQRFFQHVDLGRDWTLPPLVDLRGLNGKWYLTLDRTQWQTGRSDVNFLVLAVVTRRFHVPLLWSVLDKRGNSDTRERIAPVKRYPAHFDASTIRLLLADREFTGTHWVKFLNDNNITFAIRLKEDLRITDGKGHDLALSARLRRTGRNGTFRGRLGARDDARAHKAPLLTCATKRLGGEWLILATNAAPRTALNACRKRWAIECMFADAKARALDIEDTRLTDRRKLDLLPALVPLALAWAGRTAADILTNRTARRRQHRYSEKSWLRTGFDHTRKRLRSDPLEAITPWRRIAQHVPERRSVV